MSSHHGSTIIPCMRYRDAKLAISWLCEAFGFKRHVVHLDESGSVAHAQLTYGDGMLMLGAVRADAFGHHMVQPAEIDGRETQCPWVIVTDCRAHYEQAKTAGAVIVNEYSEKDYGGAGYSCHDPEGHLWYFGSYDPWQPE